MKPNTTIREMEQNQLLIAIGDFIQYESRSDSISWCEFQDLLRKPPFFWEDSRTHRNKRRTLESNGYFVRVNKYCYRLTDAAYARIRRAKGVPEAHIGTPDAKASNDINVGSVDKPSSVCLSENEAGTFGRRSSANSEGLLSGGSQ